MKKTIFTLLFTIIAFAGFSQVSVNFGPKVGLNLSAINVENNRVNTDLKAAWHVGVFANIRIGRFGIQPEVMYSMQGSEYKDKVVGNAKYSGKAVLGYINIPIMAKYYIFRGLNIELGPQFGFMATGKDKWERNGSDASGTTTLKGDGVTNTFDFSICGGLGYDFAFGLVVGARYNLGTTSISDFMTDLNRVGQISVGWRF